MSPAALGGTFAVREDLIALCRDYVDELFSAGAHVHGKSVWCEKTPYNLLSMRFLWELFPDAKIIHIMRHPVAVAASHLDQDWAPRDIDSVCNWLEPVYHHWLGFRQSYELDDRYVEVRLEDLAADWPLQRARLSDRLGLPDAETPTSMSPDRAGNIRPLRPELESTAVDASASPLTHSATPRGRSGPSTPPELSSADDRTSNLCLAKAQLVTNSVVTCGDADGLAV